jgi:hypothetical protein
MLEGFYQEFKTKFSIALSKEPFRFIAAMKNSRINSQEKENLFFQVHFNFLQITLFP